MTGWLVVASGALWNCGSLNMPNIAIVQMGAMEDKRGTCSRVLVEVGLEPRCLSSGPEPGLALLTHMSSLLLPEIAVLLLSKVRGQQDCPVKGLWEL